MLLSVHLFIFSLILPWNVTKGIKVGDLVRVRPSVIEPTHGFGSRVNHSSIGIVRSVSPPDLSIDFPNHKDWAGVMNEMEVVRITTSTTTTTTTTTTDRTSTTSTISECYSLTTVAVIGIVSVILSVTITVIVTIVCRRFLNTEKRGAVFKTDENADYGMYYTGSGRLDESRVEFVDDNQYYYS